MGHETLAHGHEGVVMAMTVVRGDMSKAFEDLRVKFEDVRTVVSGGLLSSDKDDAFIKINEIKRPSRARLVERVGPTSVSRVVSLSTALSWLEYVSVSAGVLGTDDASASEWLLGYADLPTRKGTSAVKNVRRGTPIMRVKGHAMHQWKEVVTAAYLSSLGMTRESITAAIAQHLLTNMGYLVSVRGFPAILRGTEAFLLLLGAGERVVQPTNAGDRKTINCTMGHVALVCSFVRVVLEVAAGLRPFRGGVGEGIHDVWVEELPRVDNELPRDAAEHDGLRLVDGADLCRAEVPEDGDDDSPAEGDGGDDGNGANYSAGAQ
eukprot:contig_7047_g1630